MGLLLTLDDIVGEEVARVGAEEGAAAACSDTSAGKLRVFDLHCDTLDPHRLPWRPVRAGWVRGA